MPPLFLVLWLGLLVPALCNVFGGLYYDPVTSTYYGVLNKRDTTIWTGDTTFTNFSQVAAFNGTKRYIFGAYNNTFFERLNNGSGAQFEIHGGDTTVTYLNQYSTGFPRGSFYFVRDANFYRYKKGNLTFVNVTGSTLSESTVSATLPKYKLLCYGGFDIIYGVTQRGDLQFFRHFLSNNTVTSPVTIRTKFGHRNLVCNPNNGMVIGFDTGKIKVSVLQDLFRNGSNSDTKGWKYDIFTASVGTALPPDFLDGFATPFAAKDGQTINFKVSYENPLNVSYVRLFRPNPEIDVFTPLPIPSVIYNPSLQDIPDNGYAGVNWPTTWSLKIGGSWASGFYAARAVDVFSGQEFYIPFAVFPNKKPSTKKILYIAPVFTWNAFNDWGGRSLYTNPTCNPCGSERPSSTTDPLKGPPSVNLAGDVWLLEWLEYNRYDYDLITDVQFHNNELKYLSSYTTILLGGHPQFVTQQMRDLLDAWVASGRNVLYLGAAGYLQRVIYNPKTSSSLESITRGVDVTDTNPSRAPFFYFRNLDPNQPEREVLGVQFVDYVDVFSVPYLTLIPDHPFFNGTGLAFEDTFGSSGRNGQAAGFEWDSSTPGTVTDPAVIVSGIIGDDRGDPPSNIELLARGTNSESSTAHMVTYTSQKGGIIFSGSSLNFIGALTLPLEVIIPRIVKNVLNAMLKVNATSPIIITPTNSSIRAILSGPPPPPPTSQTNIVSTCIVLIVLCLTMSWM